MNAVDPLIIHRLAMSLRAGLGGATGAVVLVSSARAGEGKSLIAGLLARTLATQGPDEVLLVDAGPAHTAAPASAAGIERLLEGASLGPELLRAEPGSRLHHLGHGPQFRATQWFQPAAVAQLLAQCRQRFALTLVDAPSLPACGALLSAADHLVLVVDAQRTPGPAVRAALADAACPAGKLAGVVLNRQRPGLPAWLGG
jgi:Mrp family chromosome partitioning ATPase